MIKQLLFILLFINHTVGSSQRYDFNWIFGYDGGKGDPRFGTTQVDFNSGNPIVKYISNGRLNLLEANASISDFEGNLLYYTNGYDIEDSTFKEIIGGTDLGIRYWEGLVCHQGVMFLPVSIFPNHYFLIYVNKVRISTNFYIFDLKYLVINNIQNIVVDKGIILHDTINEGMLTACQHANGRDWWILLNKWRTNIYYKYLLSPNGFTLIDTQHIGPAIMDGIGQAVFSPNGEYFVSLEEYSFQDGLFIYLYKFDRCSGRLEYIHSLNYPVISLAGVSFSPNSRYIYFSDAVDLYQIDLLDERPFEQFIKIDSITDPSLPWGSQYFMHQLGPDGRIYISNAYNNFVMHVINKPNEKGRKSMPTFNSFSLKTLGGKGIPNMPNYRLGAIDESTCDTLNINNIPWAHWRYDQDTLNHLKFEFTDLSAYEVEKWYWDFGDSASPDNTSRDTSPIHTFSENGIYEVCLIVKNENGADTLCRTIKIGNAVSTKEVPPAILEIQIWPNPVKDFFIVNVFDYNPEKMDLYLYDQMGRLIKTERLRQGSNFISATELFAGVYYLSIKEQGIELRNEKILKL